MGFYKPLDYQKWGKEMDFISWDNYPQFGAPPAEIAMSHDMMRGLKHGQAFWLMEQTPGVTNWHHTVHLKDRVLCVCGVIRQWHMELIQ